MMTFLSSFISALFKLMTDEEKNKYFLHQVKLLCTFLQFFEPCPRSRDHLLLGGGSNHKLALGVKFKTLPEASQAIKSFCAKNFHPVTRIACRKNFPSSVNFYYKSLFYACKHYGRSVPRGKDIHSKTKNKGSNCPFIIKLHLLQDPLCYIIFFINLKHNHEIGPLIYTRYKKRSLKGEQKDCVRKKLVASGVTNKNIYHIGSECMNETVTNQSISNPCTAFNIDSSDLPKNEDPILYTKEVFSEKVDDHPVPDNNNPILDTVNEPENQKDLRVSSDNNIAEDLAPSSTESGNLPSEDENDCQLAKWDTFKTYLEAFHAINSFCERNFHPVVAVHSYVNNPTNVDFCYKIVFFGCAHSKTRKSEIKGKHKNIHEIRCPFIIKVSLKGSPAHYQITLLNLNHNHEIGPSIYDSYRQEQALNVKEKKFIKEMMVTSNAQDEEISLFVHEFMFKYVSGDDICNLRFMLGKTSNEICKEREQKYVKEIFGKKWRELQMLQKILRTTRQDKANSVVSTLNSSDDMPDAVNEGNDSQQADSIENHLGNPNDGSSTFLFFYNRVDSGVTDDIPNVCSGSTQDESVNDKQKNKTNWISYNENVIKDSSSVIEVDDLPEMSSDKYVRFHNTRRYTDKLATVISELSFNEYKIKIKTLSLLAEAWKRNENIMHFKEENNVFTLLTEDVDPGKKQNMENHLDLKLLSEKCEVRPNVGGNGDVLLYFLPQVQNEPHEKEEASTLPEDINTDSCVKASCIKEKETILSDNIFCYSQSNVNSSSSNEPVNNFSQYLSLIPCSSGMQGLLMNNAVVPSQDSLPAKPLDTDENSENMSHDPFDDAGELDSNSSFEGVKITSVMSLSKDEENPTTVLPQNISNVPLLETFIDGDKTEDADEIVETSEDANVIVETAEDANEIVETSEDANVIVETSEDANEIVAVKVISNENIIHAKLIKMQMAEDACFDNISCSQEKLFRKILPKDPFMEKTIFSQESSIVKRTKSLIKSKVRANKDFNKKSKKRARISTKKHAASKKRTFTKVLKKILPKNVSISETFLSQESLNIKPVKSSIKMKQTSVKRRKSKRILNKNLQNHLFIDTTFLSQKTTKPVKEQKLTKEKIGLPNENISGETRNLLDLCNILLDVHNESSPVCDIEKITRVKGKRPQGIKSSQGKKLTSLADEGVNTDLLAVPASVQMLSASISRADENEQFFTLGPSEQNLRSENLSTSPEENNLSTLNVPLVETLIPTQMNEKSEKREDSLNIVNSISNSDSVNNLSSKGSLISFHSGIDCQSNDVINPSQSNLTAKPSDMDEYSKNVSNDKDESDMIFTFEEVQTTSIVPLNQEKDNPTTIPPQGLINTEACGKDNMIKDTDTTSSIQQTSNEKSNSAALFESQMQEDTCIDETVLSHENLVRKIFPNDPTIDNTVLPQKSSTVEPVKSFVETETCPNKDFIRISKKRVKYPARKWTFSKKRKSMKLLKKKLQNDASINQTILSQEGLNIKPVKELTEDKTCTEVFIENSNEKESKSTIEQTSEEGRKSARSLKQNFPSDLPIDKNVLLQENFTKESKSTIEQTSEEGRKSARSLKQNFPSDLPIDKNVLLQENFTKESKSTIEQTSEEGRNSARLLKQNLPTDLSIDKNVLLQENFTIKPVEEENLTDARVGSPNEGKDIYDEVGNSAIPCKMLPDVENENSPDYIIENIAEASFNQGQNYTLLANERVNTVLFRVPASYQMRSVSKNFAGNNEHSSTSGHSEQNSYCERQNTSSEEIMLAVQNILSDSPSMPVQMSMSSEKGENSQCNLNPMDSNESVNNSSQYFSLIPVTSAMQSLTMNNAIVPSEYNLVHEPNNTGICSQNMLHVTDKSARNSTLKRVQRASVTSLSKDKPKSTTVSSKRISSVQPFKTLFKTQTCNKKVKKKRVKASKKDKIKNSSKLVKNIMSKDVVTGKTAFSPRLTFRKILPKNISVDETALSVESLTVEPDKSLIETETCSSKRVKVSAKKQTSVKKRKSTKALRKNSPVKQSIIKTVSQGSLTDKPVKSSNNSDTCTNESLIKNSDKRVTVSVKRKSFGKKKRLINLYQKSLPKDLSIETLIDIKTCTNSNSIENKGEETSIINQTTGERRKSTRLSKIHFLQDLSTGKTSLSEESINIETVNEETEINISLSNKENSDKSITDEIGNSVIPSEILSNKLNENPPICVTDNMTGVLSNQAEEYALLANEKVNTTVLHKALASNEKLSSPKNLADKNSQPFSLGHSEQNSVCEKLNTSPEENFASSQNVPIVNNQLSNLGHDGQNSSYKRLNTSPVILSSGALQKSSRTVLFVQRPNRYNLPLANSRSKKDEIFISKKQNNSAEKFFFSDHSISPVELMIPVQSPIKSEKCINENLIHCSSNITEPLENLRPSSKDSLTLCKAEQSSQDVNLLTTLRKRNASISLPKNKVKNTKSKISATTKIKNTALRKKVASISLPKNKASVAAKGKNQKKINVLSSYLNVTDIEDIASGHMLNDKIINAGQVLIKKKFPRASGLQDVLLGSALKFKAVSSKQKFVQVVHCGSFLHWITVTTLNAPLGVAFVYDSINEPIPRDAIPQICNIMKVQLSSLTIISKPMQLQTNSVDCGLFALASAYTLLCGKDPSHTVYDVNAMRKHFLAGLIKNELEEFPTVDNCVVLKSMGSANSYRLHCLCRQPLLKNSSFAQLKDFYQCSICKKYYHRHCKPQCCPKNVNSSS